MKEIENRPLVHTTVRFATEDDAAALLNIYAGITYHDEPDAYWDRQSIIFHTKKGYVQVAKYNDCGCKFHRWYGLLFMEKMIGEHTENPAPVIPCDRSWL